MNINANYVHDERILYTFSYENDMMVGMFKFCGKYTQQKKKKRTEKKTRKQKGKLEYRIACYIHAKYGVS